MVQVIGEIGGSSSRWAVLDGDATSIWPAKGDRLPGFNPVSGDGTGFATAIREQFIAVQPAALQAAQVWIYGAGCGSEERQQRMSEAMRRVWPGAAVEVDSDLMGAAIGLCGTTAGLVLILGTGMNAGYFDGSRLHRPMPSLGYLLGDEGSGADIGRHLLQDLFYARIPDGIQDLIFGVPGPRLPQVLQSIHQAPHPARELAGHTALLAPHLDRPYVRELIQARFHALADLLTRFFKPEQLERVHATGSVAYGFREILADVLLDRGMTLMAVEPDPLPGLVRHHQRPVR